MQERSFNENVAVVFPGQGHQAAGMGREVYNNFPHVRHLYDRASEVTGLDMAELCLKDPKHLLEHTAFAQPAIVTTEYAALTVFRENFLEPGQAAGHSAGEITAAIASGMIGFPEGVKFAQTRGMIMAEEGAKKPGAMAAVFGVQKDDLQEICDEVGVEIANDNSEDQTVVAGLRNLIEEQFTNAIKKVRGSRIKILPIGVASHCSLMQSASARLQPILENIQIKVPSLLLLSNVTADYVYSAQELRKNLAIHVQQKVRWLELMKHMIVDNRVDTVWELGPGRALTGFTKRDFPLVDARHLYDFLEEKLRK